MLAATVHQNKNSLINVLKQQLPETRLDKTLQLYPPQAPPPAQRLWTIPPMTEEKVTCVCVTDCTQVLPPTADADTASRWNAPITTKLAPEGRSCKDRAHPAVGGPASGGFCGPEWWRPFPRSRSRYFRFTIELASTRLRSF